MPTYVYECERCGHVQDEFRSNSARSSKCEACGSTARYHFGKTFQGGSLLRSKQWAKGHRSNAMGVHPMQAEAEEAHIRRVTGMNGIQVCRKTGSVITYSQKQKVAAARACGMVDKDGGYTA